MRVERYMCNTKPQCIRLALKCKILIFLWFLLLKGSSGSHSWGTQNFQIFYLRKIFHSFQCLRIGGTLLIIRINTFTSIWVTIFSFFCDDVDTIILQETCIYLVTTNPLLPLPLHTHTTSLEFVFQGMGSRKKRALWSSV